MIWCTKCSARRRQRRNAADPVQRTAGQTLRSIIATFHSSGYSDWTDPVSHMSL